MIRVKFEREMHGRTVRLIKRTAKRFKELTGLKDALQTALGKAYYVYEGDNHVAIHTIYCNRFTNGKKTGERFAILTDGIVI